MSRKNANEFDLIRDYFSGRSPFHSETLLGIGDDAALLVVPEGHQLVVSVDTMVEGVHFLPDTDPEALGHKLLAVNLSDLAAMGATPRWATLAITLPEQNPDWLASFSSGLFALAERFQVDLVGGDTTRGPLTLTLQIHGTVPEGEAVRRDGAQVGDLIVVTNQLGAAGYALQQLQQGEMAEEIRHTLERPIPQLEAGQILRQQAHAMVDISDGLLADLGHILQQSGVGAEIDLQAIPIHPALYSVALDKQLDFALTAGDEYQLCATIPGDALESVQQQFSAYEIGCSVVGAVVEGEGIQWREGQQWFPSRQGFQHFGP